MEPTASSRMQAHSASSPLTQVLPHIARPTAHCWFVPELTNRSEVSFAPTFCVNFSGDISFARQRVGVGQSVVLTISEPILKAVPSDCEAGVKEAMVVTATLTCDHRTIDGALGAEWLKHFKSKLEDPLMMLL